MHLVIEESTFGASKYSFIDRFFSCCVLIQSVVSLIVRSTVLLQCQLNCIETHVALGLCWCRHELTIDDWWIIHCRQEQEEKKRNIFLKTVCSRSHFAHTECFCFEVDEFLCSHLETGVGVGSHDVAKQLGVTDEHGHSCRAVLRETDPESVGG